MRELSRETSRGAPVNLRILFPRTLLWLAIGVGHGLVSAAEPKPRLDLAGNPLPPDALRRLGTLRYRSLLHGEPRGRLLLDGKTFLAHTREEIRWVEMATGRRVDIWPLPKGHTFCGCSRDGRVVVLRE